MFTKVQLTSDEDGMVYRIDHVKGKLVFSLEDVKKRRSCSTLGFSRRRRVSIADVIDEVEISGAWGL